MSSGEPSNSDRNSSTTVPESANNASGSNNNNSNAREGGMNNVLKHVEMLEKERESLAKQLAEAKQRNEKLSTKTREGMQSALDTLMKKWMDDCDTKDEKVKDQFKCGLEKLVKNSAEENGVWQMMVAASALHERQVHDLDKLRSENDDLKKKIDGSYASSEARLGKRKADDQMDRHDVEPSNELSGMWDDFAASIGAVY